MKFTILIAAIALSGCSISPVEQGLANGDIKKGGMKGVIVANNLGYVAKTCDEGRAIYIFDGSRAGGIAVVTNATECAQ